MLLVVATLGCTQDPVPTIEFQLGTEARERVRLAPVSALAEYTELPETGDELIVTLASYPTSCDHFEAVPKGGILITLTVTFPKGHRPKPGVVLWGGAKAHGGTPSSPELAYVTPHVRQSQRALVMPPGGACS